MSAVLLLLIGIAVVILGIFLLRLHAVLSLLLATAFGNTFAFF